jgi:HK97 family phage portal protein
MIVSNLFRKPRIRDETVLTPTSTDGWDSFLRPNTTYSGESVTAESAFNNIGIVFACVGIRANALASLPLHVYKLKDGKKKLDTSHELSYLLSTRPNHFQTPFTFKQYIQACKLLWGNAYVLKVYDNLGKLVELIPLEPSRVNILIDQNTRKYFFEYIDIAGNRFLYNEFEIWHSPYITLDGKIGKAPLTVARENAGSLLSMQRFIGNFYKNGTVTQGILQTEESLESEEIDLIQKEWIKANGGGNNSGKIPVIPFGLKWQSLSLPLKDAEFIATKKTNKTDIAMIFNVPPFMLNDMEKATFNNFEQMNLVFSKNTLLPDCVQLEEEIKAKTFIGSQKNRYTVEFDMTAALRGDSVARADYYTKMGTIAGIKPNEIREAEGYNPSDEEYADKLIISRNYALLEDIKLNATGGGGNNEKPENKEPIPE